MRESWGRPPQRGHRPSAGEATGHAAGAERLEHRRRCGAGQIIVDRRLDLVGQPAPHGFGEPAGSDPRAHGFGERARPGGEGRLQDVGHHALDHVRGKPLPPRTIVERGGTAARLRVEQRGVETEHLAREGPALHELRGPPPSASPLGGDGRD
jgi:hypothetical protein